MSPEIIGLLLFAALVLLIFSGVPVAFAMAITGIVGIWAISGWMTTSTIVGMVPWQKIWTLSEASPKLSYSARNVRVGWSVSGLVMMNSGTAALYRR